MLNNATAISTGVTKNDRNNTNSISRMAWKYPIRTNETTRNYIMPAYEIKRSKETATGTRYLVRHWRSNKWIICSHASDNSIANPECEGQREYVLKNWKQICGKQSFHR